MTARALRVLLTTTLLAPASLVAQTYDLVLRGGRVMDPESGLDAVRDVGIREGRVAADADLTLFDPATVLDRATFAEPAQPSAGIPYVLVGGVVVVRDGSVVESARPGRAVRRRPVS
jgi:N-acyl-D-aspartate/D-glutamate deacylase